MNGASEVDIQSLDRETDLVRVETADEVFHFVFYPSGGNEAVMASRNGCFKCRVYGTLCGEFAEDQKICSGGILLVRKEGEDVDFRIQNISKVLVVRDAHFARRVFTAIIRPARFP